ncbi:MAG: WecB/TagA/CpsF family glycosyltransferase [Chloracidobacterium sp.]
MVARPSPTLSGIRIANVTLSEAMTRIAAWLEQPGFHRMAVVNAAILLDAERDGSFRELLATADLVTADGMSVVWATRWLSVFGGRLVARVAAPDVMDAVVAHCEQRGYRVYLLGATAEVVVAARAALERRFPKLLVVGVHNGYVGESTSVAVAAAIRASESDVLFVAMGSPKQELWIARFGPLTGVRFALGVGGYFDILAGKRKRAPRWMQRSGLEWCFRLLQEPRRLWRRYLIGNVAFIFFLVREWRRAGRHSTSR